MKTITGYYVQVADSLRIEYGPNLNYSTWALISDLGAIKWYVQYRNRRMSSAQHTNVSHLLFMSEEGLFQESLIHDFDVYLVKASMQKLLAKIEANNFDYENVVLEF